MNVGPTNEFLEACKGMDFSLTPVHVQRFEKYISHLHQANKQFNLTAIRDPDVVWMRHIFDSLCFLPWIPQGASVLDLGSGGGLPGIPLSIVLSESRVVLLEATQKKCLFLEDIIKLLNLSNVSVARGRSEALAKFSSYRGQFDVVVARAVAVLPKLVKYMLPFVKPGGKMLAAKGKQADQEMLQVQSMNMIKHDLPAFCGDYFCIVECTLRKTIVT